jgi:putative PIN family toxin of toxin-antitoxin system
MLYEDLFLSDFILTEFENKLRSKFGYTELEVRAAAKFLRAAAEFVQPEKMDESACRDPEDLPILGTAIAARADILITVNLDLLDLTDVRGIAIIKPGQYWKRSRQL